MKKIFIIVMVIFSIEIYSESITLWHYWSLGLEEQLNVVAKNYEKKTGIEIKIRAVPMSALNTRYVMVVGEGKGEGPDVVLGVADWIGQFNAKEELVAPITNDITEEEKLEYIPYILEACELNGEIYGIPINYNILALVYNKKYVNEEPKTISELIEMSQKKMLENPDIFGLVYNNSNYYYQWPFVEGYGISPLDKNKMPTFNSKEQINAFSFARDLQEKYKIIPREINEEMAIAMFQEGYAAFLITGPWEMRNLLDSGIDFGVCKLPFIEETNRWPKPIIGPDILMISKKSKKKELAMDFLRYMTEDEVQIELFKSMQMLPVKRKIMESDEIKNSKIYDIVKGFVEQAQYATPMPRDPELNIGVWYYGAPVLGEILNTDVDINIIADDVQNKATRDVEEYHNINNK